MNSFLALKHLNDLGKFPYALVVDAFYYRDGRRVQPCNVTGSKNTISDHPKSNLVLPLPACLTPFLCCGGKMRRKQKALAYIYHTIL